MVQRFVLGQLARDDLDQAGWVSVSELACLWASRESGRDGAWLGLSASRAEDEAVRRALRALAEDGLIEVGFGQEGRDRTRLCVRLAR